MSAMIRIKSNYSVKQTADRFSDLLEQKQLKLFARINHSAGAESIGATLRPTELLIFGKPEIGTPLMQANQEVALDLPQKILVLEDQSAQTWICYEDPEHLIAKHRLGGVDEVLNQVKGAMTALTNAATE